MARWEKWEETEKETAITMYKAGRHYNDIASAIGKSYNSTKSYLNKWRTKSQFLLTEREKTLQQNAQDKLLEQRRLDQIRQKANKCQLERERQAENAKRLKCWEDGMTDKEAAELCGISPCTYNGWRTARGLPINYDVRTVKNKKKVVAEKKRRVLTSDDLVHYRHNINTPPAPPVVSPVKVTIIQRSEPILAPVAHLANRVEVRRLHQDEERKKSIVLAMTNNMAYVSKRKASPSGRFV